MSPADASPSGRGPLIAGFAALAVVFGGFGGWAALAPLDGAVLAQGTLVVQSNRRDVQHPDGGVVARILVRDGDTVAAGDVLIRLDRTRLETEIAVLSDQLDAADALHARLAAEAKGVREIAFPPALLARAAEPAAAEAMAVQRGLFAARAAARDGQAAILARRAGQLERQIAGIDATARARTRQAALLDEELDGTRGLAERGFAPRTRVLALEREAARLAGEIGDQAAARARLEQAVAETALQAAQIDRTLREEVAAGLEALREKRPGIVERVADARERLARLDLRAPAAGTVVGLAVTTEGAVAPAGRTLLQIVPAGDALVVEANLRPEDADDVAPGASASVRLPALAARDLPALSGTVAAVSADRLVDERNGNAYFRATVRFDAATLAVLAHRRVVPGMPAEISVATQPRTLLAYIAGPLADMAAYAMRER